jgi:hypothetical protein
MFLYGQTIALVGFSLAALLLLVFAAIRVRRFGWRWAFSFHQSQQKRETSAVLFYQRLIAVLERRGLERNPDLTPLEFANALNLEPALAVTRAYNRVRFGGQKLSRAELTEIESTLSEMEESSRQPSEK